MSNKGKQFERDKAAERLQQARKAAGFGGYRSASQRFGWNENTYKSHESGRNGFDATDARVYAKAFKVSFMWLLTGEGNETDIDERPNVTDVPLISWVSAGQMGEHDSVMPTDEFIMMSALDLPAGDWVALRVEGNSMNKISPPESIIYVNRADTRLVTNGLYVVADETGAATYKRYRANDDPPFQPASYEKVEPPTMHGSITVIGRVRRSVIDM